MKVYFRRAKINPNLKDSLPDEFIAESVKEDQFSADHLALLGWEELSEEDFQLELNKNDDLMKDFTAKKEADFLAEQEQLRVLALSRQAEFEEFLLRHQPDLNQEE